ncbi:MAG: hypothetical protein K2H07_02085 [Lachnospiraceae bacterium]|nr:hypothetical protein [Lachnospiraceae bacterium]
MNTITLNDIMPKLLIISIPAIVALLFSLVFILIKSSQCKRVGVSISRQIYNSYLSVIFAINVTGFMYALVEVLLIITENVSYDEVNEASMLYMLAIGLLCAVSGILKAVIAGNSLIKIANDTSAQSPAMSRLMIFLAVAELPAIASLAMFVIKFFADK